MKTKLTADIAAFEVAFVGLGHTVHGQGTVVYTALTSQSQLAVYQSQAAWTLLLDVQHGGAAYLMTSTATNAYSTTLDGAYSANVFMSQSNGSITVSSEILNGQFGSTGAKAGTNISSLSSISGLVFGIINPYLAFGDRQIITELYMTGSNYQPSVADTLNVPFAGMLCTFGTSTTQFNAAFALSQPLGGSNGQIYIMGLATSPVPEPSTLALAGLGGFIILVAYGRKK